MEKKDAYSVAQAIADLNVWKKVSRHNWALVPQMAEDPYVVVATTDADDSSVVGRLLLFPGLDVFRDFILTKRFNDYGVALSPMDFDHYEVAVPKKGAVEIFRYRPGFVPVRPTSTEREFLAELLFECYGFMLRLESEPDLPLKYVDQNALFARKEMAPGVWQDGPLHIPKDSVVPVNERVALDRAQCEAVQSVPVYPKLVWEIDFFLVPDYRTVGPDARFLYVLAIADVATQTRVGWFKLTVDGKPDGLKRLWEGHAQRVLDTIRTLGRVPGEIHVRSPRMARFLRPLGFHLPFKLVQHAKLPALDAVFKLALEQRTV